MLTHPAAPRSAATRPSPIAVSRQPPLDRDDVAGLTMSAINAMSCEELVEVLRSVGVPNLLSEEQLVRLPLFDRATLQRLAHLARRCCGREAVTA